MNPPAITREAVLEEIGRLAAMLGKAPGVERFTRDTGIPRHHWLGVHWPRWSDALADAGLEANTLNGRFESSDILRRLAHLALELGHIPAKAELMIARRRNSTLPHNDVFNRHFGGREGIVAALHELARTDAAFSALLPMLPQRNFKPLPKHKGVEGWVYLLKSGAHYKIGRSEAIERRIKEISIALPEQVSLVHAIQTDDPVGIEAYWHRRLADRRQNGEWFKLEPEDIACFKRRKFQ